jgi:uncharacterized protein
MTLAAFLLLAQFASAASFDCSGALSPDEKLVCGDQLLSSLDTRLARVHAAELKKEEPGSGLSDTVREMSKDFLADRRSCGTDRQAFSPPTCRSSRSWATSPAFQPALTP